MIYEGTEVTIWVARRGYLENLPAIYRRSDGVGRNWCATCASCRAHVRLVEVNLTDGWRFYDPTPRRSSFSTGCRAGPRLARPRLPEPQSAP